MKYRVLYDLAEEGFLYYELFFLLMMAFIGISNFSYFYNLKGDEMAYGYNKRKVGLIMGSIIMPVFVATAVFGTYWKINEYRIATESYRNGNYSIVEGKVEQYIGQGGRSESFVIKGVQFRYSASDKERYGLKSYNVEDPIIKQGQILRISYLDKGKKILKIELKES